MPIAAIRHFEDGKILHEKHRYDNAACHYAFSAECAIKFFIELMMPGFSNNINHKIEETWPDIQQVYGVLCGFFARTGVVLAKAELPEKLFQEHPTRRCHADGDYTQKEMDEMRQIVEQLSDEIVQAALDGKIP